MRKIEFIRYDGDSYNFCKGPLVLAINNRVVELDEGFGMVGYFMWDDNYEPISYDGKSWYVEHDCSDVNDKHYHFTEKERQHIEDLLNKHVKPIHCGGCL